jgi:hypothetical protein
MNQTRTLPIQVPHAGDQIPGTILWPGDPPSLTGHRATERSYLSRQQNLPRVSSTNVPLTDSETFLTESGTLLTVRAGTSPASLHQLHPDVLPQPSQT